MNTQFEIVTFNASEGAVCFGSDVNNNVIIQISYLGVSQMEELCNGVQVKFKLKFKDYQPFVNKIMQGLYSECARK